VWKIGNNDNLDKLNTVQRKGLSIFLGLPSTSSLEAMEVMSYSLMLNSGKNKYSNSCVVRKKIF
jgi:hypothetical protein